MKLTKRDLGVLVFAASLVVFFFAIISLVSTDMKADTPETRAAGDYQGPVTCQELPGCHSDQYSSWITSPHASAWDTLNTSAEKKDWCETCHTTGANKPEHNGFDPATDEPEYLKNVTCESCHGPDPMSLSDSSDAVDYGPSLCGTCHTSEIANTTRTYHPYYDEWVNSKHAISLTAAGGIVATDPDCQGCHVAQIAIAETIEGGTAQLPVTDPQPITCAVCHDPHGSPYQSQLRLDPADLCATCHSGTTVPGEEIRHPQSSMREGTSGIKPTDVPKKDFMADVLCADCHLYSSGPPQNITGHSFSFKPEACADCHNGNPRTFDLSVDQALTAVNAYQSSTSTLRGQVAFDLGIAYSMIENATRYGFDLTTIDLAMDNYEDANYSYGFVTADKSQGAHNPQYAMALLNFASDRIDMVKNALQPGLVTGVIKDSDDDTVSGVVVRRSGKDLAISGADGSYSFEYASGTYDFDLVKDGEHVGTVSGVSIVGGSTTNAGESVISFSEPIDWTLPLLVVIIVLAILLVLLFVRSAGKKEERDEPSEEPEDEKESPVTDEDRVDESLVEKEPEMK